MSREFIQTFFQGGGSVAFSVGHKYKTSRPNDRGAEIYGGGKEADYAEKVLEKAGVLLKDVDEAQAERLIKVMQGEDTLWTRAVDADDTITWDPVRGVLRINQV